jgi:16S rRNA C967 or C1407 C5-methylase (RsmB/RsmF family)
VGGMMVYSTCSLNPIEDEAVVAELIKVRYMPYWGHSVSEASARGRCGDVGRSWSVMAV